MIRNSVCALLLMSVGTVVAMGDELDAQITKVDGSKITFLRGKSAPITMEVAADVKVAAVKFDNQTRKFSAGDPIEGGLKAKVFTEASSDRPVRARIYTSNGSKSVTQVLIYGGGK